MQQELSALEMPGRLFGLAKGRGKDENELLAFLLYFKACAFSLHVWKSLCVYMY